MTCFNPKYAQLSWGFNKEKNKMVKKLSFEKRDNFYKLKNHYGDIHDQNKPELLIIPCRKCLGCKLDQASQWATRCYYESKQWKNNCFITLTYNNENLKSTSLIKKDIQDFLKRLRDAVSGIEPREYKGKIEYPIRYFYSGEYGPTGTHRPHFHIGIFNWKPNDMILKKLSKKKQPIYVSQLIAKKWGKGFHSVQEMNYETATYIARYTVKKLLGSKNEYKGNNITPEFIETSRRGGIGYQIITNKEEFEKMLRNYGIYVFTKKGVKLRKIPQFLRNKWKIHDEEIENYEDEFFYYTKTFNERAKADENAKKIFEQTNLSPWEYLKVQKRTLIEKLKNAKSLKRDGCDEQQDLFSTVSGYGALDGSSAK